MQHGSLFLVPTPLSETAQNPILTADALAIVHRIGVFAVENAKTARAVLKRYRHPRPLAELEMIELKTEAARAEIERALARLSAGCDAGLMSEAGCPAVADPGAELIRRTHEIGARVVPLVGPSAILLALMASGLNGQRFSFHGYLPVARDARATAIRELETRSQRENETQIFIETPYRGDAMMGSLLAVCRAETLLCVARDLTGAQEQVATRSIGEWRKRREVLARVPAIFLLLAVRG